MAKKIVLIAFGIVILLVGLAVTSLGVAGLVFGGQSGVIQSGFHDVGTPTYALVSDAERVRQGQGVELSTGDATLRVDARNGGEPLFLGVARSADVTNYLSGSSYETITDVNFSPFRLDTQQTSGTARPARPSDQSFWVAKATGTAPQISWPIVNGDYRLVVMNADASSGVRSDARVGLRIPGLFGTSLAATIGGALFSLLGLGLLIWGIATKRRRPAVVGGYGEPGAYGGYPPPGYPPGYPPSGYQQQGYPPQPGYQPQPGYPPPAEYPQSEYSQSEYPPRAGYPEQQPYRYPPSMPSGAGSDAGADETRAGTDHIGEDPTGTQPMPGPPADATQESATPGDRGWSPTRPGAHRADTPDDGEDQEPGTPPH